MKRILIILILIGIIYVLGQMVVDGIKSYTQGASLVLSGIRTEALHDVVRTYYAEHILTEGVTVPSDANIIFIPVHLNTDLNLDVIARVESDATCGGGGCITTLFIHTEDGLIEPVPFAYAVKKIEVLESITSGMHDIRINGDINSTMIWDGKQYSINTF